MKKCFNIASMLSLLATKYWRKSAFMAAIFPNPTICRITRRSEGAERRQKRKFEMKSSEISYSEQRVIRDIS